MQSFIIAESNVLPSIEGETGEEKSEEAHASEKDPEQDPGQDPVEEPESGQEPEEGVDPGGRGPDKKKTKKEKPGSFRSKKELQKKAGELAQGKCR